MRDGIFDPPNPEARGKMRQRKLPPIQKHANGSDTGKTRKPKFTLTPFRNIEMATAPYYFVKGILPNTGLAVIWGPPKCGKSFFTFDLVAHVALGWSYRDHHVKQSSVVYFACEGQQGFQKRIEAFRREHHVSDMPFYLCTQRLALPPDGETILADIRQQLPDVEPGIVVIDTLNRTLVGSENKPEDMGAFIRAADLIRETFGCLVVIVHHCGIEEARPRGHTSLTGAADTQIAVRRDANKNIVATVEYMKDGATGTEIVSFLQHVTIGTDEDGDAVTSCVVARSSMKVAPKKAGGTSKTDLALTALYDLINDGETVPKPDNKHVPAAVTCVALPKWKERLEKLHIIGSHREQFRRIHVTLKKQGRVGIWEEIAWPVT